MGERETPVWSQSEFDALTARNAELERREAETRRSLNDVKDRVAYWDKRHHDHGEWAPATEYQDAQHAKRRLAQRLQEVLREGGEVRRKIRQLRNVMPDPNGKEWERRFVEVASKVLTREMFALVRDETDRVMYPDGAPRRETSTGAAIGVGGSAGGFRVRS